MPAKLNHTIVHASDQRRSAEHLARLLGLPQPTRFGPFLVVAVANDVSLDYLEDTAPIHPQHYAFLVTEEEFDEIFARIRAEGLDYWADPFHRQPGRVNTNDGGRRLLVRSGRAQHGDHHPAVRRLSRSAGLTLIRHARRVLRPGSGGASGRSWTGTESS